MSTPLEDTSPEQSDFFFQKLNRIVNTASISYVGKPGHNNVKVLHPVRILTFYVH